MVASVLSGEWKVEGVAVTGAWMASPRAQDPTRDRGGRSEVGTVIQDYSHAPIVEAGAGLIGTGSYCEDAISHIQLAQECIGRLRLYCPYILEMPQTLYHPKGQL